MKLTKGRITKLYNKKRQTHKKAKKGKKSNKQTFRKRRNYNLHNKTLKKIHFKKGGQERDDEESASTMKNVLNLDVETEPEPIAIADATIQDDVGVSAEETVPQVVSETKKEETDIPIESSENDVYDFSKERTPVSPPISDISEELFSATEPQQVTDTDVKEETVQIPESSQISKPEEPRDAELLAELEQLEQEQKKNEPVDISQPEEVISSEQKSDEISEMPESSIISEIPKEAEESKESVKTIIEETPNSSSSIGDDVNRLLDNFTDELSEKISVKVSEKVSDKVSEIVSDKLINQITNPMGDSSSIGTQQPILANQLAAEKIANKLETQTTGGKKKTRRFKIKGSKTKKNKNKK